MEIDTGAAVTVVNEQVWANISNSKRTLPQQTKIKNLYRGENFSTGGGSSPRHISGG